ncbi:family 78 glycoside hydrolase catalytic domain [Kiritimatiellaeota bacterium B1221]|nr:family 78 glycoside hydrolase catalytic domain [Kiritimatiellaeota bacterium B1221]
MTQLPTPDFSAAAWIQAPWHGGARTSAPVPYLRHSFILDQDISQAVLHYTALGLADVELNASSVSDEVFFPGWTDYNVRVRSRSMDVTHLLRSGENVLSVLLGDGWYCGFNASSDRMYYGEQPRFKLVLEITDTEGQTQQIVSDNSWKCSQGAILESDNLMGEQVDMRFYPQGWNRANFDDSSWFPVQTVALENINIVPWYGPTVKRQERLPAIPIPDQPERGPRIYDLGQNISGRVKIKAKASKGSTLRLRFAEILTPDNQLYRENLRSATAEDYYTFAGDQEIEWEPKFTFHGFRYVEASWGHPHPAGQVMEIEGIVLHSEMARTGHFDCSHPLLNQLYKNTLWGQKGNFLDIPTDCPQRDERLGWTGDAQVFVRTASLIMDVHAFFRKWLQDLRDSQFADGSIPPIAPSIQAFGLPADGNSGWADAAFICTREIYRSYGDKAVIREQLESCTLYMHYLAENKVKDHIRGHKDVDEWGGFGDWLAKDGGKDNVYGRTPTDLIGTAFYYNNAKLMAEFHEILDDPEGAKPWTALASDIRNAFQKTFLTSEGVPVVDTQTASVLALQFDLLEPDQALATGKYLAKLVRDNGNQLNTGFLGTVHLLPALEKAGEIDLAYQVLECEDYPSWIFPIKNGATTIWERWDGWTEKGGFQDPGMNSFNHYAYGAVSAWMIETVAGLRPTAPGYKSICFSPRPGGTLTHAEASLETPHGPAAIRWEIKDGELELSLTIPEGVSAELDLGPNWKLTEDPPLRAGQHTLSAQSR